MCSLYVISNKPELFDPIVKSLSPLRVSYFDGSGYPSFSALVNACTTSAGSETVIMMSDKVLPRKEHVERTIQLLEEGYAFVALYRFAFFGFKKELMRRIGMLDESYIGGGFEDDDWYIRLLENNMSMYVTHDVPYTERASSWNYDLAFHHHIKKWNIDQTSGVITRILPEEPTRWNLGPSVPTKFLPSANSYTPLQGIGSYFYATIKGQQ